MKSKFLNGQHLSLEQQIDLLSEFVLSIDEISPILQAIHRVPDAWVGAGVIFQNVWNVMHDFEINSFIKDIDIFYWDPDDLSWESEDRYICRLKEELANINIPIDVKNIARIHLWYEQRFGISIAPYGSVHESISTWPVIGACMAMRQRGDKIEFIAPYGFHDMFALRLRPNKTIISRDIYEEKVNRWTTQWPLLVAETW
ncbi:nucleotidyltransferase family protein [Vibrio quintilis]|uniref:Nucleotidyltransferase family protein n=1 Tax=Vibrio quintilis TaxID=1117707 RepID=A0A1M7Z269_9VIBR|nr:nucleotidyltransferase family protein [Vibrio quintilis]SHO58993.1 hypothetical protein VQ7734_04769 [Vibrio quintilis]